MRGVAEQDRAAIGPRGHGRAIEDVGADDAILVRDANGDGTVTDASEFVFGGNDVTDMEALHEVAGALEKVLGEAGSVKLAWKPNLTVEVDEGNAATLLKLVDTLDDDDDVQTVWGNYDISDEELEKLG